MTAMNTATKKGTRRELAAFIPATTMIKLARITIAGILNGRFTLVSNRYHSHPNPTVRRGQTASNIFSITRLFRGRIFIS